MAHISLRSGSRHDPYVRASAYPHTQNRTFLFKCARGSTMHDLVIGLFINRYKFGVAI